MKIDTQGSYSSGSLIHFTSNCCQCGRRAEFFHMSKTGGKKVVRKLNKAQHGDHLELINEKFIEFELILSSY